MSEEQLVVDCDCCGNVQLNCPRSFSCSANVSLHLQTTQTFAAIWVMGMSMAPHGCFEDYDALPSHRDGSTLLLIQGSSAQV